MNRSTPAVTIAVLLVVLGGVAPAGVGVAPVETAQAAPSGFVGVPSSNVGEDVTGSYDGPLSASALDGEVLASSNASTLEVIVVTANKASKYRNSNKHSGNLIVDGDAGLVLRDDVNHAGRDVALPADVVEAHVGHVPNQIHGQHENGSRWSSSTRVEDGSLIFHVPHFSSQTVAFESEVRLTGSQATDGATWRYNVSDAESVSTVSAKLTGVDSTERDSVSATLSDGETLDPEIAGTDPATDASVTFTGRESSQSRSASGSATPTDSATISVGGNVVPPDPQMTVTGRSITASESAYDTEGSESMSITNPPSDASVGELEFDDDQRGTRRDESYQVTDQNGDVLASGEWSVNCGCDRTISFNIPSGTTELTASVTTGAYGTAYLRATETVTGVSTTTDGKTTSFGGLSDGQSSTKSVSLSTGSNTVDVSADTGEVDWELDWTETTRTEDPSLDVDGDGSADAGHSGYLPGGETVTADVSDLPVGADPAAVSLASGTVDAEIVATEHTITEDVRLDVNGHVKAHSGTIQPGSTATLDHDESVVDAGENTVGLTVAPDLSADAPAALVDVVYQHDAATRQSATVEANKWQENHNVSQRFESDRENVEVTLPFSEDVVELHNVETRTNRGAWSSVDASSYSFDGSDLVVEHGSVSEGDRVEVRATARRIQVVNGAIDVVEPTVEGDDLNTLVEVTSKSEGFHIRTQNTSDGRLAHVGSKSWTGEPHVEAHANGAQHVYLPDASVGSTARIRTTPLEVNPAAGAIEVVVEDVDEPRFRLRQGDSVGASEVEIAYHDTATGQEYRLWSVTHEREVMADAAESPVYFATDGDDETYLIEEKNSSPRAAVAVGGGGDGGGGPLPVLALFLGVTGSVVGAFLLGRKLGLGGSRWNQILVSIAAIVGVVGVELGTSRSVVSDLLFVLGDVLGDAASTGAGAAVIGVVVLLALYGFHSRIWSLPLWMRVLTFGAVVLWIVDEMANGALTASLGDLGPLLWLIIAVGGVALGWRALKGPTYQIVGERK